MNSESAIPFETFARFERAAGAGPLFACEKPEWAAAAHAIVVGETIHYMWGIRRMGNSWVLMHSTAPVSDPATVSHDPRNPVLLPAGYEAFDDHTVEYPFPFVNPADQRYYMYYLGKRRQIPKQTGLLVSPDGDFGTWIRVSKTPVIPAETAFEERGSSHPSVAIDGDTIHIIYTGESDGPDVLCHATAPITDPARVTKDPANPIFTGSGDSWDSRGVREAEIMKGPEYFHIFYGGTDGATRAIGHVRTKDFRTFEPNPANPVFCPSRDPDAWDCDGLLTPQVFNVAGTWYMLYAGLRGKTWNEGLIWQSGLAVAQSDQ